MVCPFGYEVGVPPELGRCPLGFPGCACADEAMMRSGGEGDAQTDVVLAWWRGHGVELVEP